MPTTNTTEDIFLRGFGDKGPAIMPVEGFQPNHDNTAPVSNLLHDKNCKTYGSNLQLAQVPKERCPICKSAGETKYVPGGEKDTQRGAEMK